jgi:transcription initiation factor TFIIIB Brf1 subunit/transcription initiation factor TFIIB
MSTQTSFKQVEEEEEESGMFCPDCNSNDIVETHSDYCCRKCGAVVERRMESTHFLSRSSDGERSGSPVNMNH